MILRGCYSSTYRDFQLGKIQKELFQYFCTFFSLRRSLLIIFFGLIVYGLFCAFPFPSYAVTWQWSQKDGREIVNITLDNPQQSISSERQNSHQIKISVTPSGTFSPSEQSAFEGEFIKSIRPVADGLEIELKDPAFGFLQVQAQPDEYDIDIYFDKLGLRWLPGNNISAISDLEEVIQDTVPEPLIQSSDPIIPVRTPEIQEIGQQPVPEVVLEQPAPEVVLEQPVTQNNQAPLSDVEIPPNSDVDQGQDLRTIADMADIENIEDTPFFSPFYVPYGNASAVLDAFLQENEKSSSGLDIIAPPIPQKDTSDDVATQTSPESLRNLLEENNDSDASGNDDVVSTLPEETQQVESEEIIQALEDTSEVEGFTPEISQIGEEAEHDAIAEKNQSQMTSNLSFKGPESSESEVSPDASARVEEELGSDVEDSFSTISPPKDSEDSEDLELAPESEVIYVDADGNVVEKPMAVPLLLEEMQFQLSESNLPATLRAIAQLERSDLTLEEREEVLYTKMKATAALYNDILPEGGKYIIDAASAAMNVNPGSPRLPEILMTLIRTNLILGNITEADGYTYLLHRKYPHSHLTPAALLLLGKAYYDQQRFVESLEALGLIIQEYPTSEHSGVAARLQAMIYYTQGHYERAYTIIEFIDLRWPKMYLEDNELLNISAYIKLTQGKTEDAINTYWKYYNIDPSNPNRAATLHNLAEIYFNEGDNRAAITVLDELVASFDDNELTPKALRRIGENGVYDGNLSIDDIITIFSSPSPYIPELYYKRIIKEYPDSSEVITAKLRQLVWDFWMKDYSTVLVGAQQFQKDYVAYPESLRAKEVFLESIAHTLGFALSEENYEHVLRTWETYPEIHDYYSPMDVDLRMGLARANLNRGNIEEGHKFLEHFIMNPEPLDYALYAYEIFLTHYLVAQDWSSILSLSEQVQEWPLSTEMRNQLDYAIALSAENLGLTSRAISIWQRLAPNPDIPLYQRAYAEYFIARDAENRQDLRVAYQANLNALAMFKQLEDEQSPYADSERRRETLAALMDVTEIAGRFAESLEWASLYAEFVPVDSEDYAGLRLREARLHRKMGDIARWESILNSIVASEPETVFGKMAASELQTFKMARDLSRFAGGN